MASARRRGGRRAALPRLGLGSVLGYLAAGLAIGPFGLGLFDDPEAILHVAELGVVMFLFVIGLEMRPVPAVGAAPATSSAWAPLQVAVCAALLTGVGLRARPAAGRRLHRRRWLRAVLHRRRHADAGRARRHRRRRAGSRSVSILLFEDLLIVPLLALVAFLAPGARRPRRPARAGWPSASAVARRWPAGRRRAAGC